MGKRAHVRFALLAGALGLAATALAGCSGSTQGAQAPATAPSATTGFSPGQPTATTPAGSSAASTAGAGSPQAQAALQAYEGMVNDWVSASLTADYTDPALAQYASGSALQEITKALYTEQSQSTVSKGAPVVTDISYGQMVPSAEPTEVVINSCFSTKSWLEYKDSDGSLYNNVPGGGRKTQVLAKDEGGTWKIDQLAMNSVGTC